MHLIPYFKMITNKFINSKGYNLFRGEIGGDKTHLTNANETTRRIKYFK